jgi:hypothetical protein
VTSTVDRGGVALVPVENGSTNGSGTFWINKCQTRDAALNSSNLLVYYYVEVTLKGIGGRGLEHPQLSSNHTWCRTRFVQRISAKSQDSIYFKILKMRTDKEQPTMAIRPSKIGKSSVLSYLVCHFLTNLPLYRFTTSSSRCCKVYSQ